VTKPVRFRPGERVIITGVSFHNDTVAKPFHTSEPATFLGYTQPGGEGYAQIRFDPPDDKDVWFVHQSTLRPGE
jgi:hypothetical protein